MSDALAFVGGDEVVEPYLLEGTDGDIVDLNGMTLTGGVWWRRRVRITLGVDSGLSILNPSPARADEPADQDPHGYFTLNEAQTLLIPLGRIAEIRLTVVSGSGITMSAYMMPLERVR